MLKQLSKKERQQIVRMEQKAKKRAEKGKKKLVAPTMTPPKLTPLAITVATGLILWFSPQPAGVTLVGFTPGAGGSPPYLNPGAGYRNTRGARAAPPRLTPRTGAVPPGLTPGACAAPPGLTPGARGARFELTPSAFGARLKLTPDARATPS
ncbi:hypothetical protein CYMTET_24691 [Cymbomonas tetramitiformis]|uniref:Uncharacterized protein n=1 Tax=Cymbomonas tetramitiformis TaxID=36881 RepID=A0AAE0KZU0_9CHLO|nr:hypothetical protein CYMTET_24691 [Cymbomonas tetramitiformis]